MLEIHECDAQVLILCRNGYSYKVAVALSLFLGWLGADRFYLGYPALGEYVSLKTKILMKLVAIFLIKSLRTINNYKFPVPGVE